MILTTTKNQCVIAVHENTNNKSEYESCNLLGGFVPHKSSTKSAFGKVNVRVSPANENPNAIAAYVSRATASEPTVVVPGIIADPHRPKSAPTSIASQNPPPLRIEPLRDTTSRRKYQVNALAILLYSLPALECRNLSILRSISSSSTCLSSVILT